MPELDRLDRTQVLDVADNPAQAINMRLIPDTLAPDACATIRLNGDLLHKHKAEAAGRT